MQLPIGNKRINRNFKQESRAITGENQAMPCRCKFRYVSNFTAASCSFSATARLSCIHQGPFKCWN